MDDVHLLLHKLESVFNEALLHGIETAHLLPDYITLQCVDDGQGPEDGTSKCLIPLSNHLGNDWQHLFLPRYL